jgi:hypothetical protein
VLPAESVVLISTSCLKTSVASLMLSVSAGVGTTEPAFVVMASTSAAIKTMTGQRALLLNIDIGYRSFIWNLPDARCFWRGTSRLRLSLFVF